MQFKVFTSLFIAATFLSEFANATGSLLFDKQTLTIEEENFDGSKLMLSLSDKPTSAVNVTVSVTPHIRVSMCSSVFTPNAWTGKALTLFSGQVLLTRQLEWETTINFKLCSQDSRFNGKVFSVKVIRKIRNQVGTCRVWGGT